MNTTRDDRVQESVVKLGDTPFHTALSHQAQNPLSHQGRPFCTKFPIAPDATKTLASQWILFAIS